MPQFESPVGPEQERNAGKIWPRDWHDANPYKTRYNVKPGKPAYHTGADLNCDTGDANAPVYTIGDGKVIYAQRYPTQGVWGGLVIIYHGQVDEKLLFSRYGHVQGIVVAKDATVTKGQLIARIGGADLGFDPHLHFDISTTSILKEQPGYWPGLNKEMVERHFVDPKVWLYKHIKSEAATKSAPTPQVNSPAVVADAPNTELRYVIHMDGAHIRKDHATSAQVVHELKKGASLSVMKTGGMKQDGYIWAQVSGGEFNGYWVAVCKDDADPNRRVFYLSKQPSP